MGDIYKESLKLHEKLKGKIEIALKTKLSSKKDLSLIYTPGVAEPSRRIAKNKHDVYKYTGKGNSVAIVTDGSAVLGLGNIGAEAALPVMEGKAALLKEYADIDAFPICLKSQKVDDIVATVKNIAPTFGAINLEDIKAPQCFEVEARLQDLGIPVMHDDQHGTAVVLLAALLNAAKVVGKNIEDLTVVINGAGAAGTAIARLLKCIGIDDTLCRSVKDIVVVDSKGALHDGRPGLNTYKKEVARFTNQTNKKGKLSDVIVGADVFIGVSVPTILSKKMIRSMNDEPIVFALANPEPEIKPDLAIAAGAAVVATGRSDFPNQVNNVLSFPGLFRGALDARASRINSSMKLAAAHAIASIVKKPKAAYILPSPIDKKVVPVVAKAVKDAWQNG